MKYITVEDSLYQISDKNYKKLEGHGTKFLESLEYNDMLRLLRHYRAKHIGAIFMSFRY